MLNQKKFPISPVLLLAFLACIAALNYFTPMHSDDYSYKILGHDWNKHLSHYMGWSGRLVADYISPTLLAIESKLLLALVQTSGLFLLVHTISRSTRFVRRGLGIPQLEIWLTLSVLALTFLSIPVFGQVMLWVVGSANYLWTAVLYSGFVYFVLKYVYTKEVPFYAYPLALLAGCTNENASATLLAFSGLTLVWLVWKEKKANYRFMVLLGCFALGAAVLIGAPGNQARLADPYFQDWVSLSVVERLALHFSDRMVRPFEQSSFSYLLGIILVVIAIRNKRPILDERGLPTAKALFLVFFIMSLFATAVMGLSPTMPPRSLTAPFIFLMFSLSFGVLMLLESGWPVQKYRALTVILLVASALYFTLLIPAYHSLHIQERIRIALIEQASPEKAVDVPNFHMRKVPVKNSRMYLMDGHKSPGSIASYHGVKGVNLFDAGFDYAVISQEPERNAPNIWRYSESPWETTFVTRNDEKGAGGYGLSVTSLFGGPMTVCMERSTEIGPGSYFYTTIKLPKFAVKSYSVEAGCG